MALSHLHQITWHPTIELTGVTCFSNVNIHDHSATISRLSSLIAFKASSSYLGWIHKPPFNPFKEDTHDTVYWWLVWTLIRNEVTLYYQHIKGYENIITNFLSRDIHISYKSLYKHHQIYSSTTYICAIPHQNDSQRYHLLDIVASSVINTTGIISKATTTNQSGNRYRWYILLTHTGIEDKLLGGIQHRAKKTLVLSFAE